MRNFRLKIWDEWTSIIIDDPASADCEVAGIIESMMSEKGYDKIILKSSRLWIFRRLVKLWGHTRWSKYADLSSMLCIPGSIHGEVSLFLSSELYEEILSCGNVCAASKRGWEWMRGLWGNNGNIFLPKNGYNLVIRSRSVKLAARIQERFKSAGIKISSRTKSGYTETMIRNQNDLVTFLCKIRLYNTSLLIEQRYMIRAMRERANKLVNCDASNIRKSLEVAQDQLQMARSIKMNGIFNSLPDKLKEIIDARLENPSATLTELGSTLEKPVSKSTVKYRWKRIKEITGEYL